MWRQKYRCFNSTLVQLKVRTMISGPLTCTGFNSTLVQLKERSQETVFKNKISFNSTLVQLKEDRYVI